MEGAPPPQSAYNDDAMNTGEGANGIPEIPSLFFGNLDYGTSSADIRAIFEQPLPGIGDGMDPIEVERVDLKRGFCFVYLKQDFKSVQDRDAVYNYAQRINGMHIDNVSKQLRAEFARGDGRVKRKEESRRGHIEPNETLFVVNYNVDRTRREDLEMLFKDYGRLVRVDMRRNYAFVQFESTEDAIKAKDATDGGKLDDTVLSVEFVVSKRRDDRRRSSPSRRGRYDDYDHRSRRSGRRSRSRSYGRGRYRSRSRSPRRRRSRSRSRSRDYGGHGRDRRSRSRSRDYGRDRDNRDRRSAGGGSSSDRGYRTDDRGYGSRPI